MSVSRHILASSLCTLVALCAIDGTAHAQKTPEQRAEELNDQGKALFRNKDLAAAEAKFREAVVISSDGRFYFNLCVVLDKQGKLREALVACAAVTANNTSDRLVEKAAQYADGIRERTGDTEPGSATDPAGTGGGGDQPNTGNSSPQNGGTGSSPPTATGTSGAVSGGPPEEPEPPQPAYRWTLGAAVGPALNLGFGREAENFDDEHAFAGAGSQLRFYMDWFASQQLQVGYQGYVQTTTFGATDDNTEGDRLLLVDIGGAMYQHRQLRPNLLWTPLVGVHLAFESIGAASTSIVTYGLRGEVAFGLTLGANNQHLITVTPAINYYLAPSSSTGTYYPADYGLDRSSATFSVTVGYTARFVNTFNAAHLITLE